MSQGFGLTCLRLSPIFLLSLSINVEPYDSTGVNALDSTPGRYDKALGTIENTLKSFIPGEKVRICVYSNVRRPIEYLFQC